MLTAQIGKKLVEIQPEADQKPENSQQQPGFVAERFHQYEGACGSQRQTDQKPGSKITNGSMTLAKLLVHNPDRVGLLVHLIFFRHG